jgi:hypothetical protein
VLTAITRDPAAAARVDTAGVDRIGVDIERLNKHTRQGHAPGARISDHELADLAGLARVVRRAALFARLNPLHDGSRGEVEQALSHGVTALMLPYFSTAAEVETFVRLVAGRAEVVLLLETAASVVRLHEILGVPGVGEVIVGLNDLHRSTGVANHFELVASDLMTLIARQVRSHGIRFGFGGLARVDDVSLPVSPDLVFAQHARLGSTSAWLSRSFFRGDDLDVSREVARLRQRLSHWGTRTRRELLAQRDLLRRCLRDRLSTDIA